eukprot:TRINITY_DN96353_c0_g1_i1.p1 TRINITY_DN96353_c0_g1~~TRINITY_DN96353_c0_g1_i1.p1  ORF type:complete len:305 (+),score=48.30 TRINITY_DN96353_c0_g1_i1:44-958(+)
MPSCESAMSMHLRLLILAFIHVITVSSTRQQTIHEQVVDEGDLGPNLWNKLVSKWIDDPTSPLKQQDAGQWHRGAAYAETPSRSEWCSTYDFAVKIIIPDPKDAKYQSICSGTIAGNKVLTAAHCVRGARGTAGWAVQTCRSLYRVIGAWAHPLYDPRTFANDVAILLVAGDHYPLRQVFLLEKRPNTGAGLNLAGFGLDENEQLGDFNVLKSDTMKVMPCQSGTDPSVACISSGPRSHSASCGGDSGGPWFLNRSREIISIVGVNSFGRGDCGDASKTTGIALLGGFTEDWIKEMAPDFVWEP